MADWSVLDRKATVTVFNDHLDDAEAVIARLQRFDRLHHARAHLDDARRHLVSAQLRLIASTAPQFDGHLERLLANRCGLVIPHAAPRSFPVTLADICFFAELSLFHNERGRRAALEAAVLPLLLDDGFALTYPLAVGHFRMHGIFDTSRDVSGNPTTPPRCAVAGDRPRSSLIKGCSPPVDGKLL